VVRIHKCGNDICIMESTLGEKVATLYIRSDLAVGHAWIIFLIHSCLKSLKIKLFTPADVPISCKLDT
jgi:hypothetical protein